MTLEEKFWLFMIPGDLDDPAHDYSNGVFGLQISIAPQRVGLAPGESHEVRFTLDRSHLRMLEENMKWVVEPGVFRVMAGASSKDIRLRGELVVR